MNAYQKAQSLGLTGSDSEIVAVLQTLTVTNIPVVRVAEWLRVNRLWYLSGPQQMAGAFQVVRDNPETPPQVEAGLGQLYSAVFGGSAQNLLTTDPYWAGVVYSIVSGLTAVSQDAAALVDSFYALDGGRPYKELTVEQYTTLREDAELKSSLEAIVDDAYAAYVIRHNAAKSGIANGSLTTEAEVLAVLEGVE